MRTTLIWVAAITVIFLSLLAIWAVWTSELGFFPRLFLNIIPCVALVLTIKNLIGHRG